MESVHVAVPGEIVSFDEEKRTAVIQPTIRKWRKSENPPLLLDVPVYCPRNVITEINPGDGCLVVFADNCIDAWFQNGGVSTPISARMHDVSDGFAFVGFKTQKETEPEVQSLKYIYYGESTTAGSTRAKAVTIPGITKLVNGLSIRVRFSNAQTYNGSPQLNLNKLGAKSIRTTSGVSATRYEWYTGEVIDFVYDGSYWVMINGYKASTTYYGFTKLQTSGVSTSTAYALTPSSLNQFAKNMITGIDPYDETGTYAIGDRCRNDFNIYRCIVPIETAEDWNSAHWAAEPTLLEMIEQGSSRVTLFTIDVQASSAQTVIIHHSWITDKCRVITKNNETTYDFNWTTGSGVLTLTNTSSSGGIPAMTLEIGIFAEAESPTQEDGV